MAVRIRMKTVRPQAPALLSDLCDGHSPAARRPRAGRTWDLRPVGSRDRRPGDAQQRADQLLAKRRRQPSDKVQVLIKKYGAGGTHLAAQQTALARLARAAAGPSRRPRCPGPEAGPADEEETDGRQAPPQAGRSRGPAEAETEAAEAETEASPGRPRLRPRRPPRKRADRAMRFDVLTLFPDIFQGYLGQSLLKRAIEARLGGRASARHPRLVARET